MDMTLHPTWLELALRLVLTVLSCMAVGLNRESRNRAAGLRTIMLVGLAAALAMIQANLLLDVTGKTAASFGEMDLMRLPLGVLTGVGFIGGGAILRRGDLVTGVTTAATLWVMTVIGLCYGGGQLVLGGVGTVLVLVTLWLLQSLDERLPRDQHAALAIVADPGLVSIEELDAMLRPLGYRAIFRRQEAMAGQPPVLCFDVRWRGLSGKPPLDMLKAVSDRYTVTLFELTPESGR